MIVIVMLVIIVCLLWALSAMVGQTVLYDFCSGWLLLKEQRIKSGDWVRFTMPDVSGTVRHVGWRLLTLETALGQLAYVPNHLVMRGIVEHAPMVSQRVIQLSWPFYHEDAATVTKMLGVFEIFLRAQSDVQQDGGSVVCQIGAITEYSLHAMVSLITKPMDADAFSGRRQTLLLGLLDIVREHELMFALPAQTVHVPRGIELVQLLDEEAHEQLLQ